MIQFETSIVIREAPDRVFDHWADGRLLNDWNPNVVDKGIRLVTPEPLGVGSRFRGKLKGPGEIEVEIVEYERPRRVKTLAHARVGELHHTIIVEPVEGGTKLTQRGAADLKGIFWLLSPVMKLGFAKSFRDNDQALKLYLEKGQPR